jgi:hypothetical protein
VSKLSRTQGELEDTQAQLDALLKRQEMLQARAKDQTAKVDAAAKRVQELGQRLALETTGTVGASPFTAAGPGFVPAGGSPFKRQRPAGEAPDDEMGGRPATGDPAAADLGTRTQPAAADAADAAASISIAGFDRGVR